jgi:hypothetical protein
MLGGGKWKIWAWALVALLVVPPVSDFASWSYWRQDLQRHADSAAEAGALALRGGKPAVPAASAWLARHPVALAEPPIIEQPPGGGTYRRHADAVRVRLGAERAPFFWSKLFGPARMTAVGTVAVIPDHPTGTRIARVE